MFYALSILVALLHLLFVVYVMGGGMLWLQWRRAWIGHVIAVAWASAVMFFSWTCPLTPLENYLRKRAGASGYEGGFIERYILSLVYPGRPSPNTGFLTALFILGVNAIIYLFVWRARKRHVAMS